jgi:hypothetical protein
LPLVRHIEQTVLEARRTQVRDQNLHRFQPPA